VHEAPKEVPALLIIDLPNAVKVRLTDLARQHGRSPASEALIALFNHLERHGHWPPH
jgi:hypothetical protein